ncbi:MAG: exodeoxyribonuclease V subunit gamma [Lentisphaeria bacterium]|nr:exodeoxyribonuclease V subunit gamma [Lentisphaeria bacterium]
MAFYLYQHFSLTALAEKFQRLRREGPYFGPAEAQPFRSEDIFVPEKVVVPTYGMRIWLTQYLAQQQSVVANIDFPYPRNFIAEVLKQHFTGRAEYRPELFTVEVMAWRIMAIMGAAGAADGTPDRAEMLSALTAYLQQGDERPALRQYELALRIAGLFDQYMIYRADDLVAWRTELPAADPERWQAALWQQLLVADDGTPLMSPADAFVDYLKLPAGQVRGEPDSKPEPVAVFGASTMPPVYFQILQQLATGRDVHFFYHNPCLEYWADHPVRREKGMGVTIAEPGDMNKLIENFGFQGREFFKEIMSLNGNYEEPESLLDDGEREAFPQTLLGGVQHDIVRMLSHGGEAKTSVTAADDSIIFHDCHNDLRQVEVLHDRLLALFHCNAKDGEKRLYPDDVLVMAPDISRFAPAIAAVFDQGPLHDVYAISDRSLSRSNAIAGAFVALFALTDGRFEHSRVMDLLAVQALRQRFHFSDGDVERLRSWLYDAYVCWGMDGADRQRVCGIAFDAFSWRHGINRLMLGLALDDCEDGPMDGEPASADALAIVGGPQWWRSTGLTWQECVPPLPLADNQSGRELLGNLSQFLEKLAETAEKLRQPRVMSDWQTVLTEVLTDFFQPDNDSAADYAVVRQAIRDAAAVAAQAGYADVVSSDVIKRLLQDAAETPLPTYPFMSGKITFCSLQPMRSVPRRVIVMLGMDDGAFPRVDSKLGFNVMERKPRRCDRSRQWEDRYLFLESIMAAEQRLWIFYRGRDEHKMRSYVPALPVCELQEYLAANYCQKDNSQDIVAARTIRYPLHPFDARCYGFSADGRAIPASYNAHYFAVAEYLASGKTPSERPFWTVKGEETFPPVEDSAGARQVLDIRCLTSFLTNASEAFLTQTLGFPGHEWTQRRHGDLEPLDLAKSEKTALCRRLAEYQKAYKLTPDQRDKLLRRLQAENAIPPGEPGLRIFNACLERSRFEDSAVQAQWAAQRDEFLSVDLEVGGRKLTLQGTVRMHLGPAAILECLFDEKPSSTDADKLSDYREIAVQVRHLFVRAALADDAVDEGSELKTLVYPSVFCSEPLELASDAGFFANLTAREQLVKLLEYYYANQSRPLPLLSRDQLSPLRSTGGSITKTAKKNNLQDPFFSRLYCESDFADEEIQASISAKTAELFGQIVLAKQGKK